MYYHLAEMFIGLLRFLFFMKERFFYGECNTKYHKMKNVDNTMEII